MAITDLTGTKWRINDTSCSASYGQFTTVITLNDMPLTPFEGNIYIGYTINQLDRVEPAANCVLIYTYMSLLSPGDIIEFTGGTDATNADLIAFMQAHGEQIIEPTANEYTLTQNLTNLTHGNIALTITADEGYSLPAQADIVVTGGTIVSYDDETGELVVTAETTAVEVTCESATPSGYEVRLSVHRLASSSSVSFYDGQDSSSTLLATVAKGNSTTVTVTSGYIYFVTSTQDESIAVGGLDDTMSYYPPQFCYAVTGDGSIAINPSL